jgi:hypothetical protein
VSKRTNQAARIEPISSEPRQRTEAVPVPVLAPALAHTPELIEQIRARAYELYLERGCQHGRAEQDWLDAEAEIIARASLAA